MRESRGKSKNALCGRRVLREEERGRGRPRGVIFDKGSRLGTVSSGSFHECRNIAKTSFSGLRSVEFYAFHHCWSPKSISRQNGLREIKFRSFRDRGLEEDVFPASAEEISANAFSPCEQLKSVRLDEELQNLVRASQTRQKKQLAPLLPENAQPGHSLTEKLEQQKSCGFEHIGKLCFRTRD